MARQSPFLLANFLAKSCGFGQAKDAETDKLEEGAMGFLCLEERDLKAISSELMKSMEQEELTFL